MRAMVMTAFGGPDVLELTDIPVPEPGPLDLLVQVHATAVNPVDCKTRTAPRWGDRAPPMVLGFDVSGTIVEVGREVKAFEVGNEVYASPSLLRDGANAEYVVIDARSAARIPATLKHHEAAALPLVGLTAWESLFAHGRIEPGETVLIHAGAGGVGHVAIQLARHHGCRVITTAGNERSLETCHALGADVVIDYKSGGVAEQVMDATGGEGCPMVFDTVGGSVFSECVELVALNGRLVTIVPGIPADNLNKLFGRNASLHFEFMGATQLNGLDPSHQGLLLEKLARLVDAGSVKPVIENIWELEQLAEAHERQETQRSVGKQVVRVRD